MGSAHGRHSIIKPSLHPCLLAVLIATCAATRIWAQSPYVIRGPHERWRTVETAHLVVHYPAKAAEFAACLLPRLEPIYSAVSALVGYDVPRKTTLVISDAMALDGAYASANSRAPVIVLQTQPSSPRSAGYSDCATARVTHELTHILQLSRPWTRDHPLWVRAAFGVLPASPGPIVFRRKPWLRESYAEHIEGVLAQVGAPYTTPRGNAIRRLVRSDKLPPYRELDDSYEGRYLIGAAFVDELAQRSCDSAFARLWERMASRGWMGENAEFQRLFGAPPDSLYSRFARNAAAKVSEVATIIEGHGVVAGRRVRSLGYTDVIAVSPDGATLAAVFGSPLLQLTLWPVRDSSALDRFPLVTGQSPNSPRFTRDGKRVVFVSWELISGGVWRPDVFEWEIATRRLRRITRGASVRELDPMPDGRSAVGTRCEFGVCDLVMLDLATGALRAIARGSPSLMYARPRASSRGEIVVAVQSGARSRIALVDALSGERRYVDPDDGAWRYEPAFLRDGRIVLVSEASGIPALEILNPASRETRALSRAMEPAYAPEPDAGGDGVYFVAATETGSVLRHIALRDAAETTIRLRDSTLAPAVPVPFPTPSYALGPPQPVAPARAYGIGPRFYSVLPVGSWSVDGAGGGLSLWTSDIVGRMSVMGTALFGQHRAWHGYAVDAAVRATRLPLFVNAAWAEQATAVAATTDVELWYRGVSARTELDAGPWARRQRATFGASASSVELGPTAAVQSRLRRLLGGGSYSVELTQVGNWYASELLTVAGASGTTSDTTWARWTATARVDVGSFTGGSLLTLAGTAGVTSHGAPSFEHFAIGGLRSALVDELSLGQRVPQPLLRSGTLGGSRMATLRLSGPRLRRMTPYIWSGAAGDRLRNWQSLAGVSGTFSDDPRRNWRVPGAQLGAGAGYAFGDLRGLRAYVSLSYRQ